MNDADSQLELHVQKVKDIFEDPNFSVSSTHVGKSAGVEQIKEKILSMRRRPSAPFTFIIRIDDLEGSTPSTVKEALRRFCTNRIEENQVRIRLTKREGRRYLVLALLSVGIISACIYAVSVLFPKLAELEGIKFFVEVIVLAAWVVLWDPIEELVYAWRPLRDENDVYRLLLDSTVAVT